MVAVSIRVVMPVRIGLMNAWVNKHRFVRRVAEVTFMARKCSIRLGLCLRGMLATWACLAVTLWSNCVTLCRLVSVAATTLMWELGLLI